MTPRRRRRPMSGPRPRIAATSRVAGGPLTLPACVVRRHADWRAIGEDDGRFQTALRRQCQSTLFGGSYHLTKRVKKSAGAKKSAGVSEDACEIVLEGADRGTPKEDPAPPNPISYARSLPRDKALQREVLIAYKMNGRDLPRDHEYPVRAIVPGHYGMASVKWLTGIQAVREPFHGYWQTSDYGYWASIDGKPVRRALREMKLKSEIARPCVYETLVPNRIYTVFGAAWAGETDVTEIAVSTDGGQTWAEAEFLDPVRRHACLGVRQSRVVSHLPHLRSSR
jgi:hypothetical protein